MPIKSILLKTSVVQHQPDRVSRIGTKIVSPVLLFHSSGRFHPVSSNFLESKVFNFGIGIKVFLRNILRALGLLEWESRNKKCYSRR